MLTFLQPVKVDSLKEACSTRLEALILSGQLPVGQKLPPERDLARQLGVSRPVVHEALVDLAGKGLVSIVPRVGTLVSDYRKEGSLALLNSLLKYQQGDLAPKLLEGLLAMRVLFELETARLAAHYRTSEQIKAMRRIIRDEAHIDPLDLQRKAELDFELHHLVALASDNQSYPLLLNSFKPVYTNLTRRFFGDPEVIPTVISYHRDLVDAIYRQDDKLAVAVMQCLLAHGEEQLRAGFSG